MQRTVSTEYGSDAPTERETEGGILDLENC